MIGRYIGIGPKKAILVDLYAKHTIDVYWTQQKQIKQKVTTTPHETT